jgi:hypothetical protein
VIPGDIAAGAVRIARAFLQLSAREISPLLERSLRRVIADIEVGTQGLLSTGRVALIGVGRLGLEILSRLVAPGRHVLARKRPA